MPERFKVVCIPFKVLYKCSAFSSEAKRDRYTGFCPPPEDDSARLSEGVGAMSGGRFVDCPAGAGSSGRPGNFSQINNFIKHDIKHLMATRTLL